MADAEIIQEGERARPDRRIAQRSTQKVAGLCVDQRGNRNLLLNRGTRSATPACPEQPDGTKAAATRFTAPAYRKFESISLQR